MLVRVRIRFVVFRRDSKVSAVDGATCEGCGRQKTGSSEEEYRKLPQRSRRRDRHALVWRFWVGRRRGIDRCCGGSGHGSTDRKLLQEFHGTVEPAGQESSRTQVSDQAKCSINFPCFGVGDSVNRIWRRLDARNCRTNKS